MGPDPDTPKDLGPSSDIYMCLKNRQPWDFPADSQCHLLKQQAVRPDVGSRMYDYSIRMRQQEPPFDH